MSDLEKELASTLNKHSQENASNTPDFILAQYLLGCLAAFNQAVQQRETWYGRDARPSLPELHDTNKKRTVCSACVQDPVKCFQLQRGTAFTDNTPCGCPCHTSDIKCNAPYPSRTKECREDRHQDCEAEPGCGCECHDTDKRGSNVQE